MVWDTICKSLLEAGKMLSEPLIDYGYKCLTLDPVVVNYGSGYGLATGVNMVFSTIACSLATVFFVIDFCSSSVDIRQTLTFENVMKLLIRISICGFFITHAADICYYLIRAVNAMIDIVTGSISGKVPFMTNPDGSVLYSTNVIDKFNGSDLGARLTKLSGFDALVGAADMSSWWFGLIITILALIAVAVSVGCGIYLVGVGLIRIFKIYMVLPFASLAFASMAAGSNTEIGRTLPVYIKSFLGLLFEGIAVVIGIRLFINFSSNNNFFLANFGLDMNKSPGSLNVAAVVICFNSIACYSFFILLVSMIKNVPKKVLGLGDV